MPFARWMGAPTRAYCPRHQDEASATCRLDAVAVVDTNYPRAKVPKRTQYHITKFSMPFIFVSSTAWATFPSLSCTTAL